MPIITISSIYGSVLKTGTAENLQTALEKWIQEKTSLGLADLRDADLAGADLTGAHLRGAHLTGANLTGADLRDAHLTGADLTGANLTGADLTGANLRGADLRDAHLTGADLRGAHLAGANLVRAHLAGANLRSTILQLLPTPWQWVTSNRYPIRTLDGRTLTRGQRSRTSQHVGTTVYQPHTLYKADIFSSCPTTACHPGLYVADANNPPGTDPIYVVFWLDEALIAGTPDDYKCRVRRFYVLDQPEEFETVTADQLDE